MLKFCSFFELLSDLFLYFQCQWGIIYKIRNGRRVLPVRIIKYTIYQILLIYSISIIIKIELKTIRMPQENEVVIGMI